MIRNTPKTLIHSWVTPVKPIVISLKRAKNPEIFTTLAMNAVIKEGDPAYTSGSTYGKELKLP
ncbi:hypothetical protein BN1195_02806 [Chryseobacterium oranimense G311]|nr:hypothetical protein BN1195_02806 [Chryseobacterium oranimense G311]